MTDTTTDLPALTGTRGLPDYMIREAETARAKLLSDLEDELTSRPAPADVLTDMIGLFRGAVLRQTNAGWWLDPNHQSRQPCRLIDSELFTREEKARRLAIAKRAL